MSSLPSILVAVTVALGAFSDAVPLNAGSILARRQSACVTQEQMVAINAQTTYWPRCSASQGAFPGDGKTAAPGGYTWGDYCETDFVAELNSVLVDIGICDNMEAKINFLSEIAFETGYFTTLGQPIDGGSGVIHMIPANWDRNAADMAAIWPDDGIAEAYGNLKGALFVRPQYAWKSVAAWYLKSSCAIIGAECCVDLLHAPFDTQTKCILGRVNDRSQARAMVAAALTS